MHKGSVKSLCCAASAHLVALVVGDPQVQRPLRRLSQLPGRAPILRSARQGTEACTSGLAIAIASQADRTCTGQQLR